MRWSVYGQIRKESPIEGQTRDARAQARHAAQRPLRQAGDEPQAGHRHRPVGGAARGRKGAKTAEVLAQEEIAPGCSFQVVRGNLLEEPVEAIVNAANGHLAHAGGVAGIISRAAGPSLQEESDGLVVARGPFPTGTAVATTAG